MDLEATEDSILPPEVINMVLKHLDGSVSDLLNCRSVCRTWNEFCLKHLRKSGKTQILKSDRIKEYVTFVKETKAEICLRFEIFIIHSDGQAPGNQNFAAVDADLNSLAQSVGSDSVVGLQLKFLTDFTDASLLPILIRLAPELLTLSIVTDSESCLPSALVSALRARPDLRFPRMTRISCNPERTGWSDGYKREEWELYSILISASPQLETLDFNAPLEIDGVAIQIPFGNLKYLKLGNDKYCIALQRQVEAYNGPFVLESFVHEFWKETGTPSLPEDLNLDKTRMKAVLEKFFPTLKHLSYYLNSYTTFRDEFLIPFTSSSLLEELTITGEFCDEIRLDATIQNFSPEFLPSLKRVTVPISLFWDNTENVAFQTVTQLNVHLPRLLECHTNALAGSVIRSFWNHVLGIFPNASKVCLKGFQEFTSLCGLYVKCVLNGLIKHPRAEGIHTLEISNYYEDYLGEILNMMDLPMRSTITLHNFPKRITPEKLETAFRNLYCELFIDEENLQMTHHNRTSLTDDLVLTAKDVEHGGLFLTNLTTLALFRCSSKDQPHLDSNSEDGVDPDPPPSSTYEDILDLNILNQHFPHLSELVMTSNIASSVSTGEGSFDKKREIESRFPNWSVTLI